jgi:hypothetical protein
MFDVISIFISSSSSSSSSQFAYENSCPTIWGASWRKCVFKNPHIFPTQVSLSPDRNLL